MTKIIRNVATFDDILHAVPPGKLLVMAACWTGQLVPKIDSTLTNFEKLSTPFMTGNVLHAEPAPSELVLGQQWTGDLRTHLIRAVHDARKSTGDTIDATEAVRALESVRAAMGAPDPDFSQIADGLKRLRRARDAASSMTPTDPSSESNTMDAARTFGARAYQNTRDDLKQLRAAHSAHWDKQAQPTPHPIEAHARGNGSVSATKDESVLLQIARTGSPFGSSSRKIGGAYRMGDGSKPVSPAELNRKNREHWDRNK